MVNEIGNKSLLKPFVITKLISLIQRPLSEITSGNLEGQNNLENVIYGTGNLEMKKLRFYWWKAEYSLTLGFHYIDNEYTTTFLYICNSSISWLTAFVNKAAFLPHQLGKYLLLCITLDLQKAKEKKLTYFRILVQLFQMHFVGCTTYIRLTINTHLPKVCYCAFNHLTWFRIGFENCNASKIGNYRTLTLDFNYGPLAKIWL